MGCPLMNLVDGWQIRFPGEARTVPRGREGWSYVTIWCSCSWGLNGVLWTCVLVPPPSGCPQACNMSPRLPQVLFNSVGSSLTLLLMFSGCYLAWDCALLQLGFVARCIVVNHSCTKFLGAENQHLIAVTQAKQFRSQQTGRCLLLPLPRHDLALRNVSLYRGLKLQRAGSIF